MPHNFALITTISAGLGFALIFGFIAERLKLPTLVGYLLAGIVIGPSTPGFVADTSLAGELAEIGVMLLMFGVGLHFSPEDLLSVRKIAVPGAIVQIVVATAMGTALATSWGWSLSAGIVFGLALSVASTVVLLRALEGQGVLESVNGRIAVGWLVVEDFVTVLALVLLPPLAGLAGKTEVVATGANNADLLLTLAFTLGQVALFVALMLVVGKRFLPWLLWQVARTGSRELFTLCVIATAVGIAQGSAALFGVSFALGAFFAGMMLRGSELSLRAAKESLPLRDAFSVLFFVSVGMLFDPRVLIEQPLHVLAVLAIIIFGKSLAAFLLVLVFRYPLNTALTVSASLAQIGEFSFILAGLGISLQLLPAQALSLILAGAIISIAINPLVFRVIAPVQNWIRARSTLARILERPADPLAELPASVESSHLTGHVVLVGYGQLGRRIAAKLGGHKTALVVAEQNRELVEQLRARGVHAVAGDAADPAVLIQAHIARARILVVTTKDVVRLRQMIEIARTLNPDVEIAISAQNETESERLRAENAGRIFVAGDVLATSMAEYVLEKHRPIPTPPLQKGRG